MQPTPSPATLAEHTLQQAMRSAVAAYGRGAWSEAEKLCRDILKAKGDSFAALQLLGMIAARSGRLHEAATLLAEACVANPNDASAHNNLGGVQHALKRPADALASYERALALNPNLPEAWNNRGVALRDLKRPEEALSSCERALALKPDYADAQSNCGNALHDLRRLDEALGAYDRAIQIKPGYAEAHSNRGTALCDLGRLDEALAGFEDAIRLKPDYADAYIYRGDALREMRRTNEALQSYNTAIAASPDRAEAYLKKAELLLLTGDYRQGWDLYEWRWKTQFRSPDRRFHDFPLWSGEESLAGKNIVIHPEVGFGDFIMFARYTRRLQELGARVVIYAPPALAELFSTLRGNVLIVEEGNVLPHIDLHCPIMSLPRAFKTTLDTIPAEFPYLAVPAERQSYWRRKLGAQEKPRVGLVWAGKANRNIDVSVLRNRSMPLKLLEPLRHLPLELHSLQKDVLHSDARVLAEFSEIRTYQTELHDFSDTAALIEEMDLVVTIDTSVAHLAGALGKPVWMMLPYSTDYRWGMSGDKTPWYPTATLFRQPDISDWTSIVHKVATALTDFR